MLSMAGPAATRFRNRLCSRRHGPVERSEVEESPASIEPRAVLHGSEERGFLVRMWRVRPSARRLPDHQSAFGKPAGFLVLPVPHGIDVDPVTRGADCRCGRVDAGSVWPRKRCDKDPISIAFRAE